MAKYEGKELLIVLTLGVLGDGERCDKAISVMGWVWMLHGVWEELTRSLHTWEKKKDNKPYWLDHSNPREGSGEERKGTFKIRSRFLSSCEQTPCSHANQHFLLTVWYIWFLCDGTEALSGDAFRHFLCFLMITSHLFSQDLELFISLS